MKKQFLSLIFCLCLLSGNAQAAPPHVNDYSGELDQAFIQSIASQTRNYPFQVYTIFLKDTQDIDLGARAHFEFQKHNYPEDSMLVVVALDRRKMGIHVGQALKESLKEEQSNPLPSTPPLPDKTPLPMATASPYHWELIPSAIEEIVKELQQPPKNTQKSPSKTPVSPGEQLTDQSNPNPPRRETVPIPWLAVGLCIGLPLGSIFAWKSYKKWKKKQEFIQSYSLNAQINVQKMETLLEDIEEWQEKSRVFQGQTQQRLQGPSAELKQMESELEELLEHFDEEEEKLLEGKTSAVPFFERLEKRLGHAETLFGSAEATLKGLKQSQQQHKRLWKQFETEVKILASRLEELQTLHPELSLEQARSLLLKWEKEQPKYQKNDPLKNQSAQEKWRDRGQFIEQRLLALPHIGQQLTLAQDRLYALEHRVESMAEKKRLKTLFAQHKRLETVVKRGALDELEKLKERFFPDLDQLEKDV